MLPSPIRYDGELANALPADRESGTRQAMNMFLRFAGATNRLEVAWITLWAATISISDRTASESLGGVIDSTHLLRAGFVGVAAILVATTCGRIRVPRWEPLTLMLVYGLVALASTLWSVGAVATVGKAGELLVAVLVVWQTARLRDAPVRLLRLVDWVLLFHGALLLVALAGYVVAPSVFSEPSWGVLRYSLAAPFMSANGVAGTGATIAIVALARFLRLRPGDGRRLVYGVLAALFAVFPFLAQGRTGLAILVVGVGIVMLRRRALLACLVIFPTAAVFVVTMQTGLLTFVQRGQTLSQLESLTGRTRLWELAVDQIATSPWVGVGFGVGARRVFATADMTGFTESISSIHNGPLEVLLGTGVLGFVVWAPAVLWGIGQAFRALAANRELDIATLAVPWIARTTMGIGLGGWLDPTIGTFLAATTYLALVQRRGRPPSFGAHSDCDGSPVEGGAQPVA